MIWNPTDVLQIRLDNEWREQYENSIRSGPDDTIYSHFAASYYPNQFKSLEIFLSYDKPWDEDFLGYSRYPWSWRSILTGCDLQLVKIYRFH